MHSDTELAQWADTKAKNNCANTSKYFKVASGSGCTFKTPDGVWWDIDDIMNPTIALKEADLSNLDNDTTFKLVTSYDPNSRAFRTDDLAYESTGENKDDMKKLFAFVNNEKNEDNNNFVDSSRECNNDTKNSNNQYISCQVVTPFVCNQYSLMEDPNCKQEEIKQYNADGTYSSTIVETKKSDYSQITDFITDYKEGCRPQDNMCDKEYQYIPSSNGEINGVYIKKNYFNDDGTYSYSEICQWKNIGDYKDETKNYECQKY